MSASLISIHANQNSKYSNLQTFRVGIYSYDYQSFSCKLHVALRDRPARLHTPAGKIERRPL